MQHLGTPANLGVQLQSTVQIVYQLQRWTSRGYLEITESMTFKAVHVWVQPSHKCTNYQDCMLGFCILLSSEIAISQYI